MPARAFVDWASRRAVPPGALDRLDPLLDGKRIVFLGEPDHYVHEKYEFRLAWIRHLFERGWRAVYAEMGRNEGARLDGFLASGTRDAAERCLVFAHAGRPPLERPELVEAYRRLGLVEDECVAAVHAADRGFFRALRSISEARWPGAPRLRFGGYDLDTIPGGAYQDIASLLSGVDAPGLRRALEPIAGESMIDEAARVERALELLDVELDPDTGESVRRELRTLCDSLRFVARLRDRRREGRWLRLLAQRERTMFRQMDELLHELGPDGRVILLGHNGHLSMGSSRMWFGPGPYPHWGRRAAARGAWTRLRARPLWRTIGTHLAEAHPGEVFSIWMLYDRGRHFRSRRRPTAREVRSSPARIESLLAEVGDTFVLPLHDPDPAAAPLLRRANFVVNGGFGSGDLAAQADAIFFVREVSEPRGFGAWNAPLA